MNSRKIVYRETAVIAAGEVICVALMLAVYALLGHFDQRALCGGIAGAVVAILNFFFMGVGTSLAADRAEAQDVKGGTRLIKLSYYIRTIAMFLILFACVKSGLCDAIACVLPIVFVRIIITVAEFFRKPGEVKK